MRIGKVFVEGLVVAILIWILYLIVVGIGGLWVPLTLQWFPELARIWHYFFSFVLTIICILVLGYISRVLQTRFFASISLAGKRIRKFLFAKIFPLGEAKEVVIVQLGNWRELGIIVGEVIMNEEKWYRIFIPTSPFPFTGRIVYLPPNSVFSPEPALALTDLVFHYTSSGLSKFLKEMKLKPKT